MPTRSNWLRSIALAALVTLGGIALLWLTDVAVRADAASPTAVPSPAPGDSSPDVTTPASSPTKCSVGFYVVALHDSNLTARTFGADLWVWSVCPNANLKPLTTMEFVNANKTDESLSSSTTETDGSVYSSMKVTGTFRYDYQLVNYPFDRQQLEIQVEDANSDVTALLYSADTANTTCAPNLALDDWIAGKCSITTNQHKYTTTFGDPTLQPGSTSSYSEAVLSISLQRADSTTEFLKSIAIVYPAMLLVLITFFLMTEATSTLAPRLTTVGGALFAVALSMKSASSQLNETNHFTVLDGIHLAALLCIVAAGFTAVWTQIQLDHKIPFSVAKHRSAVIGLGVLAIFISVNAVLILLAVRS